MNLENFSLRRLQKESARALATIEATNDRIYQFNKQAQHDSQNWYKTVIAWYVGKYKGLPSEIGPGKDIKLLKE